MCLKKINLFVNINIKMSFKCYLCDYNFTQKHNLEKHLDDKRCKSQLLNNWNSLNSLLEQLHKFKANIQEIQPEIEQQLILNNLEKIQEININQVQPEVEQTLTLDGIFTGHEKEIRITPDKNNINNIDDEIDKLLQEIKEKQTLTFDGIFSGREKEIRITPDKMISVFDFITVVSGQQNPRKTWERILNEHGEELGIVSKCHYAQFGKTKKTPVINVQGMVKLLFWLPGETAKQFRAKSAETMIRYLGGDLTLIDEIKAIDKHHIETPNNVAQVFREEILFNQDQINTSKKLINYYGDKKDIFYMFSFKHDLEWYVKYGVVGELREFHERVQEHLLEFSKICFHNIIQCSNIYKVESDFKESALVQMNKVKIPKKNGGNHVEIIKLSEIVTVDVIKEEMIKVAGDRMLDPPPRYTAIENSNELTKQIEIKELTKQIEAKELTEQRRLELEIKKIEYRIMKLKNNINRN